MMQTLNYFVRTPPFLLWNFRVRNANFLYFLPLKQYLVLLSEKRVSTIPGNSKQSRVKQGREN